MSSPFRMGLSGRRERLSLSIEMQPDDFGRATALSASSKCLLDVQPIMLRNDQCKPAKKQKTTHKTCKRGAQKEMQTSGKGLISPDRPRRQGA